MDADLKIARAKTQLVLKHPFFGSCAMGLNFTETAALPTMATDGKSILWNREFVDKYDQDMVMGVIAHEVLHVVFKHCLRIGDRDHKKWNICTDIAINDILRVTAFPFPLMACTTTASLSGFSTRTGRQSASIHTCLTIKRLTMHRHGAAL